MPSLTHNPTGPQYWRSLEHLADAPQVRAQIESEFPGYDPNAIASLSRRRFMKLMGASMALAGVTLNGCRRWPKEKIVPHTVNPEGQIPGVPEQYATAMELGGVAQPLLATATDGRPIKLEGNNLHPMSVTAGAYGSADVFAQASVLELYDPDRSRGAMAMGANEPARLTPDQFAARFRDLMAGARADGGAGLAVLCEPSSSLALAAQKARLLSMCPRARWFEYEPISRDAQRLGLARAMGRPVRPVLRLDRAEVVVLLDADVLGSHPARVRYANDWSALRRSADDGRMSRVYLAETGFGTTGSIADERLPATPDLVRAIAIAIARGLGDVAADLPEATLDGEAQRFVRNAVADLKAHTGKAVVAAGEHLDPDLHALVASINAAIAAPGNTLVYIDDPAGDQPTGAAQIGDLADAIRAGNVTTLLILGGNPAYDAPADTGFARALASVPQSVHLSLFVNETTLLSKLHAARAHYLECWGDARAWDGTVTVQQPLILPLFGGLSAIEMLALACGDATVDARELVRAALGLSGAAFDKALHDGLVEGSALPALDLTPARAVVTAPAAAPGYVARLAGDASVHDGRFANNGWLMELPRPLTKIVWDNAALLGKADADALGVTIGDVVRLTAGDRFVEAPVMILPGQPAGVIGLQLGYGRRRCGNVGDEIGFDAYPLRSRDAMAFAAVAVEKTGRRHDLVSTQDHHLIDAIGAAGRDYRIGDKGESGKLIKEASFAEYRRDPHFAHRGKHGNLRLQLFEPPHQFNEPHAWGMTIDMNACIGCNACVVACQAENNIPIVGKAGAANNREMHWLRVDRYFKGSADDPNPQVIHQPLMCVHCENAPCEQVCPVAATVHDTEGLNTMVYNRCIGTRYCSNNCPYKVRRFNYFDWHSKDPRGLALPWLGIPDTQQEAQIDQVKRMVFNPDVTVRMRGVMEKCTYCTQRIQRARIDRRNRGETVRDGDVVTACQQSCPTEAIVFGNLNDGEARVTRAQKNPRTYTMLDDLNVRPRTKHLAKVRNPAESQTLA